VKDKLDSYTFLGIAVVAAVLILIVLDRFQTKLEGEIEAQDNRIDVMPK